MTRRPLAEPEGEAAPGDERSRAAHAPSSGPDGGSHRAPQGLTRFDARTERIGGWRQRVEHRLVADHAATTPSDAVTAGPQHPPECRRVEGRSIACGRAGLEECRAVQRSRCSADGRDKSVADRPQQLSRWGLSRKVVEDGLDGSEADHEVVTVVAVPEHGVEPGEIGGMPFHDEATASERRADGWRVDDVVSL